MVTIIVLLILGAVAINLTVGKNGIFTRAQDATRTYEMSSIKERAELQKIELETGILLPINEELSWIKRSKLLKLISNEFEDSTIRGNTVVVEDEKYDVHVGINLDIVVTIHDESKIYDTELELQARVYQNSKKNAIIEIIPVLGIGMDYEEFARRELDALKGTEEEIERQKEDMFCRSFNYHEKTNFESFQELLEFFKETYDLENASSLLDILNFMFNQPRGIAKNVDEIMIEEGYVEIEKYMDLQTNIESVKLILPDKTEINKMTNDSYSYSVNENGIYHFSAVSELGKTAECDVVVNGIKHSIYQFADEVLEVGDIVYYPTLANEYVAKSELSGIEEDQVFSTKNELVKCIVLRKKGNRDTEDSRSTGVEIVPFDAVGPLALYGKRGYMNDSKITTAISEMYTNDGIGKGIAFSSYSTSSFSNDHTHALYNLYNMGYTNIYLDRYRSSQITPENLDSSISMNSTSWYLKGKGSWICDKGVGPINVRSTSMSTPEDEDLSCYMYSESASYTYGYKAGVVPLILLDNDVIITSGNGDNEPYVLEKYREE